MRWVKDGLGGLRGGQGGGALQGEADAARGRFPPAHPPCPSFSPAWPPACLPPSCYHPHTHLVGRPARLHVQGGDVLPLVGEQHLGARLDGVVARVHHHRQAEQQPVGQPAAHRGRQAGEQVNQQQQVRGSRRRDAGARPSAQAAGPRNAQASSTDQKCATAARLPPAAGPRPPQRNNSNSPRYLARRGAGTGRPHASMPPADMPAPSSRPPTASCPPPRGRHPRS